MPVVSMLSGVSQAAPASGSASASGDKPKDAAAVAQEFEAFVLQYFVEELLPEDADAVFGAGMAGAFWKSMLAEHVARELARGNGLGIARLIAEDLASRRGR